MNQHPPEPTVLHLGMRVLGQLAPPIHLLAIVACHPRPPILHRVRFVLQLRTTITLSRGCDRVALPGRWAEHLKIGTAFCQAYDIVQGHRRGIRKQSFRGLAAALFDLLHQTRGQSAIVAPVRRLDGHHKARGGRHLYVPRRVCCPIRHSHLAHIRIGNRYGRRAFRRFFLGLLHRPRQLLLLAFGKPLLRSCDPPRAFFRGCSERARRLRSSAPASCSSSLFSVVTRSATAASMRSSRSRPASELCPARARTFVPSIAISSRLIRPSAINAVRLWVSSVSSSAPLSRRNSESMS